ncbi:MAG: amidase, partial [Myxococcota bacterium]|nr:amidase [Myxococcota bacterium]
MDPLAFLPATALRRALAEGRLSSRELLDHHLARVDALDPQLGAVVTRDDAAARAAADAADRARAAGDDRPLLGLPMTVKDCFETAGLRTTAGVPELAEHVPGRDADAVARLRAAGAVVFGKTNLPTWASDWQTWNPLFGLTRNPWDPARSPGGSSGGSAAALAAGLTPLELGSDVGGSIRVPAHWSGVCGHKPSHGVVPQRGHLPPAPGALAEADLNVVGPLARCVDDLELGLEVLAGPTPERATGWRLTLPPPRGRALREFRVGLWLDDPDHPVDDAMRGVLEDAVGALGRAGARVDATARPALRLRDAVHTYLDLFMPLQNRVLDDATFQAVVAGAEGLPPDADDLTARALRAQAGRHRDWLAAHERREQMRARWAALFRDVDVLLCPVNLRAAIPHDVDTPIFARTVEVSGKSRPYLELIAWPALVTMAWLPSTVVPVGRTPEGLPV